MKIYCVALAHGDDVAAIIVGCQLLTLLMYSHHVVFILIYLKYDQVGVLYKHVLLYLLVLKVWLCVWGGG